MNRVTPQEAGNHLTYNRNVPIWWSRLKGLCHAETVSRHVDLEGWVRIGVTRQGGELHWNRRVGSRENRGKRVNPSTRELRERVRVSRRELRRRVFQRAIAGRQARSVESCHRVQLVSERNVVRRLPIPHPTDLLQFVSTDSAVQDYPRAGG